MPGTLTHSPADILRWALIAKGLGTDPELDPQQTWPIYAAQLPPLPDLMIVVSDTLGTQGGRTNPDSERQEHHGIQVMIRSATHNQGYEKSRLIATTLDTDMRMYSVTVHGVAYRIAAVTRTTDVLPLGKEVPESKRSLFTINAIVSLRQQ